MRYLLLVSLVTTVVLTGCRSNPIEQRQSALLRAEILDLEDQYYAMKSKYLSTLRQLKECRGEPFDGLESEVIFDEYSTDGSVIDYESGIPIEIHESGTPTHRPGVDPTIVPNEILPPNQRTPDSSNGANLDFDQLEIENSGLGPSTNIDARRVSIHRNKTKGQDVDGKPGDEGLVLLVQPRDQGGNIIASPAKMTVSIIDPNASASRQRIGLWRFEASEIELFTDDNETPEKGILLHLPWNQNPPQSGNLTVFVRYVTDDGRKLETSTDVKVTPPQTGYSINDPVVVSWTQQGRRWDSLGQGGNSPGSRKLNATPASSSKTIIDRPAWRPIR